MFKNDDNNSGDDSSNAIVNNISGHNPNDELIAVERFVGQGDDVREVKTEISKFVLKGFDDIFHCYIEQSIHVIRYKLQLRCVDWATSACY